MSWCASPEAKPESNVPIHTVLNGRINTYNRQPLPICLSTPCLTLLLHRRPAISVTSHHSTRAERVNRAATLRVFFTAERTPAEALNSLQFAYPEINDEKGGPRFFRF